MAGATNNTAKSSGGDAKAGAASAAHALARAGRLTLPAGLAKRASGLLIGQAWDIAPYPIDAAGAMPPQCGVNQ